MVSRPRTHASPGLVRRLLPVSLLLSGCASPAPRVAEKESLSAVSLQAGPAAPEATPRSRMPLDQICPMPEFPQATVTLRSKADPKADRLLTRGQKRYNDEHWADAMAAFERALEADPDSIAARIFYARAAIRLMEFKLARRKLDDVIAREPRCAVAHLLIGDIEERQGDTKAAMRSYRLAAAGLDEPQPASVHAHRALARLLETGGYTLAAAEQYDAFLRKAPGCADVAPEAKLQAALSLGDLRMALEMHPEAVDAYHRAMDLEPRDPGPRRRWILALASAGRADEALEEARKEMIATNGGEAATDLLHAVCDAVGQPGKFDEVISTLAQGAKDSRSRLSLAMTLLERDKSDEAAAILMTLVDDDQVGTEAATSLAEIRMKAGDVSKAFALALKLVHADPSLIGREVRFLIGDGRDENTRNAVIKAAKQAADGPDESGLGAVLYARLLAATGESKTAADVLNAVRATARDPALVDAALAICFCETRQWEEAIRLAEKVIEGGGAGRDIYMALGLARDALDEYESAKKAYLAAFEADRHWDEPLFRLAEMTERAGRQQEAEQLYRRILDDVNPRNALAREKLVILYLNAGDFDKSREYFSDFDELGQTGPSVDRCRAMLALTTSSSITPQDRLEEYLKALHDSLQKYPGDFRTHTEIARSYSAVGRYQEALAALDEALKIAPDDVPSRELKARLLFKLLKYDQASAVMKGLLVDRPRSLAYIQELLEIAESRADWATMASLLRELLTRESLKDQHPVFTSMLIRALTQAEDWDAAIATAKTWLDDAPDDVLRRSTYLRTLGRAGRHEEAITLAESLLKKDPQSRTLQMELLSRLQDAKRFTDAIQLTLNWLIKSPEDLDLNAALIRLCWSARQWDDAIELSRIGLEMERNRAVYETLLGESFRFAHRIDEAIKHYKDKLENAEATRRKLQAELNGAKVMGRRERTVMEELRDAIAESRRANLMLIGVMVMGEKYRVAERQINRTLKPELEAREAGKPFDQALIIDMRNLLSEVFADTGRPSQALQQLEAIYELDPTDPGINNNLGYLLADLGQDLERAEKMIRFSLAENPGNHASLDSLGWVLYKQGHFEEAAYYIRQALKLSESEDPVLHDHLGDALYRAGDRKTAEAEWRTALKPCLPDADPPPDHDQRELYGRLKQKLDALEAGKEPKVAEVPPPATSSPESPIP